MRSVSVTVSTVEASDPQGLTAAAGRLGGTIADLDGAITEQQGADLARALREASTRSNARAGFAAVDALAIALGVGALAFTAVALSGCPTWVRPACGAPGAYSCVSDRPHVCSPSGALTPVGDLSCGAVSGRCVMSDAGVAHCAPLSGGGAE